VKIKLYRTIILSVVLYECETLPLPSREEAAGVSDQEENI
jgi:hypothetical protein